MNQLTVDIMENFVGSLELTGYVNSYSDDGTNTTIVVGNTYNARAGMTVDVDGADYNIVSVVSNTSITFEGLPVTPMFYTVQNPYYFHGTPIMTNNHVIASMAHSARLPMVYLAEVLRETDPVQDSSLLRQSQLRLFFLDESNKEDWDTDDHYSNRIKGLSSLVDAFILQARRYNQFFLVDTEFTRINHVNWGVFVDQKGHTRRIFDDDLSGVELNFTLPIRKCQN